jgi:hypothetical protein
MRIPIHYTEGVKEVRNVRLYVNLEQYRAYSQGVEAGGSYVSASTTGDGGFVATSTGSGGYTATSTNNGGGNTVTSTNNSSVNVSQMNEAYTGGDAIYTGIEGDLTKHKHSHAHTHFLAGHNHDVEVPSHSHSFQVLDHTHQYVIQNHSHSVSINLPNHSHPQINDIFVGNRASNVSINVNGQTIAQNINASGWYDITAYINTSDNLITISGTNGRIEATVVNKVFVAF